MATETGTKPRVPATVWALGFVSLCMDTSSEMIHSLLPMFLVTVLNTGAMAVGLIEGVSEGIALIMRSFSGVISDRLGRRKALALAGYALGALTKPFFAMAPGAGVVFAARFVDRIGKGVRGAPRDALLAEVTPLEVRGRAFGLRQSLDTIGAFLGPLIAMAGMLATAGNFRVVFWMAVLPGVISVAILALAVKEPHVRVSRPQGRMPGLRRIGRLGKPYWAVVAFGTVFTLARFSEAFLLLRSQSIGLPPSLIPAVLVVMNLVYSFTAYPAGFLSDRFGRNGPVVAGLLALILSDLVLAAAGSIWGLSAGVVLWGLHMGLTQGVLSAMVADSSEPDLLGTAYGLFSMASGMAVLLASLIAGWIWDYFGAPATFLAGAGFAGVAFIGYLGSRKYMLASPAAFRADVPPLGGPSGVGRGYEPVSPEGRRKP
jgi:MFS family permease